MFMFPQALQDDASAIFLNSMGNVEEEPKRAAAYVTRVSTTLYDRQYLTMIMDEAHVARKLNKVHTAAYALHSVSANIIAMTTTPVMSKLQVCILHSISSVPLSQFQFLFTSRIFEL
jgi:superfamily II DNA or RNA helicase